MRVCPNEFDRDRSHLTHCHMLGIVNGLVTFWLDPTEERDSYRL